MPPHIHHIETAQDNRIILSKGSKLENQHTRMTLGTLSWVYKPSDYLMVIGPGSPCWSYQSQDLRPAKTGVVPCHCRNRCILDRMGYRCILHDRRNKLSGDQNPLRLPVSAPYISVNNAKLHSVSPYIGLQDRFNGA